MPVARLERTKRSLPVGRLWLVALAWALACLAVFPAIPGAAHFSSGEYTHKNNQNCQSKVDPINFGFYGGPSAWPDNAAVHVSHHSDWDYQHPSFTQQTKSENVCRTQWNHRANCCGGVGGEHNHIRFFYAHLYPNDSNPQVRYTTGDAHYDAWAWSSECRNGGHAVPVDGFNRTRNRLRTIMKNGGHSTSVSYWGNDQPMYQKCSKKWVSSDGNVVWAWIG